MRLPHGESVPLWNGKAPLAHGDTPDDMPTITAFYPLEWRNNHKALVIFPGGAYAFLADHEGRGYADFFAKHGYTAFVVNYRVAPAYRHPAMLSDGARAVRLVRENASDLGVDPDRIGVVGSSAGGHLAASVATLHAEGLRGEGENTDKNFGRPDFCILCYPVISGVEPYSHFGSFENLLGANHSKALAESLSMEKAATAETPKTFIFHTWQDACVPVENSFMYAMRLKQCGVPVDLHVYEVGGHGMGIADGHPWTRECLDWLAAI